MRNCYRYLMPFMVWSTTPTVKQCIWVIEALQDTHTQTRTFYSPTTGASICMCCCHLAPELLASLPKSQANCLYWAYQSDDPWLPMVRPQDVQSVMGFIDKNILVLFQTNNTLKIVGNLIVLGINIYWNVNCLTYSKIPLNNLCPFNLP